IKKGKYDAIVLQSWTNLTWWLAFLACLKFKIPILFMTDSNVSSEDSKSKIKIYFKRLVLQKFLFKKANGFLTSGTANEKFHRYYGVPKEKMIRLYFSWGYEKFLMKSKQLEQERKKLRESLNIKEKDFVILYVGRLSYEKSLFCLLDAFDKINIPNKKLLLVGDGPLRSEIEQKIKRLKTKEVFIMGFQPRKILPKFYVSADVFVLPSTAETWGIVVNEAMCFNLPVIVSDKVGAGTDLIKNGYNGFIFKAEDSEDLSSKLIYLAKLSEKDRMIFRNRSKEMIIEWVNNLDVEEQMAKVFNLLEKQKNRKS
ncbi:MAG: glycosyltransferase family 4 protein, partial [Candidatus Staskawiczbacteria bacterium]|nr:glycosyltransferase family 4 protein [Candidatus Staskawiczbacteria bacterium]